MSTNSNTILGLLAGTAIGATLGILFAPQEGEKLRSKLRDEAGAIKSKLAEEAHYLQDQVVRTVSNAPRTLEEQLEDIVADASHKTEDLVASLEGKLKKIKDKNKELLEAI